MIDLPAARTFIAAHGRLLDRSRFAMLVDGEPAEPVLRALAAYANDDGGFGRALEPDIRDPASQPIAAITSPTPPASTRGSRARRRTAGRTCQARERSPSS